MHYDAYGFVRITACVHTSMLHHMVTSHYGIMVIHTKLALIKRTCIIDLRLCVKQSYREKLLSEFLRSYVCVYVCMCVYRCICVNYNDNAITIL